MKKKNKEHENEIPRIFGVSDCEYLYVITEMLLESVARKILSSVIRVSSTGRSDTNNPMKIRFPRRFACVAESNIWSGIRYGF